MKLDQLLHLADYTSLRHSGIGKLAYIASDIA